MKFEVFGKREDVTLFELVKRDDGGYNVHDVKFGDDVEFDVKINGKPVSVMGECGGPEAVFPPDYKKKKEHPEKGIQGIIVTDQQKELKRMYPHILNGSYE